MNIVVIGGSDAGISAALRARELNQAAEVKVLLADEFPNFSICGLPFFLSGETPDWKQLGTGPNLRVSKCSGNIGQHRLIRKTDLFSRNMKESRKRFPMIASSSGRVLSRFIRRWVDSTRRVCFCCTPWKTASGFKNI